MNGAGTHQRHASVPRSLALTSLLGCAAALFTGCGSPSTANIELRKQLEQRDAAISQLKRQHNADLADIAQHRGPATTSLSSGALASIYTVHGIKLGRLTGGANLDPKHAGEDGLTIQVTPTDDDGQTIKAAGTFDVTAYDLSDGGKQLGHWTFDDGASRANWYGSMLLYSYVLPCPWTTMPTHSDVTVRVTFTDTLTGRQFTEQKQIHLQLPATTQS